MLEPALPLPGVMTGRAAFLMTLYSPEGVPLRSFGLGDVDARFPVMSMYKALVVGSVLRGVDAGRWTLKAPFATTAANRSIEKYPPGRNSLQTLADRALRHSDNTAADILQLALGPQKFSQEISAQSPCSTVLLTSKAIYASLAGLNRAVLGPDLLAGSRTYAAQPWPERLATAGRLIAQAQTYRGPQVEAALARYFGTPGHEGATYRPELELEL